jgi:hypothetical protein
MNSKIFPIALILIFTLFIFLTCLISCAKEISLESLREGKYLCSGNYYRHCRSCIPQDTQYSYKDHFGFISFKGDSVVFGAGSPMWKINNDSFVYDIGPGYPGIYYGIDFFGNDSFHYRYYQFIQAYTIEQNSYCKKIK